MPFHVGQKVVCVAGPVNPPGFYRACDRNNPEIGSVYTIREVRPACIPWPDGYAYLLEEILNDHRHTASGYIEPGFLHQRFRPVKNVEIVQELLASVPTDKNKIKELEKV